MPENGNAPAYNLAGTRPAAPADGFTSILAALRDRPGDTHVGIIIVDAMKTTRDTDTGNVVPTVRIRQAEFPSGQPDRDQLMAMLDKAQADRTGQPTLTSAAGED